MVAGLPDGGILLRLESSTQSLKATALDPSLEVVATQVIQFDSALPQYSTTDGVHRGPNSQVTTPTLMWVEALDLLLHRLQEASFPFQRVVAVSGSGQQHGSVYWATGARSRLQSLRPTGSLVEQLGDAFATKASPVWMDSSTGKQSHEIEEAVGGPSTGSRAYEHFTADQIRKIYQEQRSVYDNCERISLESSFTASLLVGDYASIDFSDAAATNLVDPESKTWSAAALDATAPGLQEKLGQLAPADGKAGNIHDYFVQKYGFSRECVVVNWSGHNPDSLAAILGENVPTSSNKKRGRPEDAEASEQSPQKRAKTGNNGVNDGGGSGKGLVEKGQQKGGRLTESLVEGGGQTAEVGPGPLDLSDPAEIKKENAQLLELVHELEAHLLDSGKQVKRTKFSESLEASQHRLNRFKKKKAISHLEGISRKKPGSSLPPGPAPTHTVSTFGPGVISPSVWSQGVFSSMTAVAGGQSLPYVWAKTGEETPVSELKQLPAVVAEKPQEGQAGSRGQEEEEPASSGNEQGSKEKDEDEVNGGMRKSPPRAEEAHARLVFQKDKEIEQLRRELETLRHKLLRTEAPQTPRGLPPLTPRGHVGSSESAWEATIAALQGKLKVVSDENEKLQQAVLLAHSETEKLKVQAAALETTLKKENAAHAELVQKLDAAQMQLAKFGSDRDIPAGDSDAAREIRQLREALGVLRTIESELRRQSTEKDARITAAASIVEQLKQATEHLQDEKKSRDAEMLKLRRENVELHSQVAEAMRLLSAQEESIAALQKKLRAAAELAPVVEAPEAQAARSILEVAKEFNVKTIDKLKVELQKARLVESLEGALQQSIRDIASLKAGTAKSTIDLEYRCRIQELETMLKKVERENAGLRQEVSDLSSKVGRKFTKDNDEEKLQKQLDNKTREVEDLSKDLQASYVQHSKVQRMLELLREANIGSVEKVRTMIKRHQQFDSLEIRARTLEAENASLQRKLKRLQGLQDTAADTGSPAADAQKPWLKKDSRPEGPPGKASEQEDNSREDIPIAVRRLGKSVSLDPDRGERVRVENEGRDAETKEGGLSLFGGRPTGGPLEGGMRRSSFGLAREGSGIEEQRRRGELEQALAEQKQRADRLEARLKKAKADEQSGGSESQAISAMVRVLGLEKHNNESGVAAIEKVLQAAAAERESMKKELEQKREEVDIMGRRLRDVSHKSAKMEELQAASAEAAGEAASLQMQLMTSQSMLQQLQRRNRNLLMDAAAAQAVLELLRGPYIRDVGQLQLLLERAIELSINEQR